MTADGRSGPEPRPSPSSATSRLLGSGPRAARVAHALIRRPSVEETGQVGLITRGLAFALDVAIIALVLSIASNLLRSFLPASLHSGWTWQAIAVGVALGAVSFVLFWGLIG